MNSTFRFMSLLLMFFASQLFSQWVTVSTGGTKPFNSIHSPTLNYVYAAGDSGLIRISTTGGSVFVDRSVTPPVNLKCVKALSTTLAYVCGEQGLILKTTDSGVNWTYVAPGFTTLNYLDLDFINGTTGIAVGQQRRFAYTYDGGANWTSGQINITGQLNLNNNCVEMNDNGFIFVASNDTMIAGLYNSYIHRSTNGGLNYASVFTNVSALRIGYVDLQFVNNNTGFAAMNNGAIAKTTNAGANWILYSSGFTTNLKCIYFVDTLKGFAIGDNYYHKKTTNGGVNWYFLNTPGSTFMNDNYFNDASTGYIAGTSGFIMKTVTGGGQFVGINQPGSEIPGEYSLGQNYPNPFNPTTKILFDIPKESNVKLVIYNILGSEVKVLLNENVSAGKYEAAFDASNLPSGTYFYRLETGNYVQTKKMILIK